MKNLIYFYKTQRIHSQFFDSCCSTGNCVEHNETKKTCITDVFGSGSFCDFPTSGFGQCFLRWVLHRVWRRMSSRWTRMLCGVNLLRTAGQHGQDLPQWWRNITARVDSEMTWWLNVQGIFEKLPSSLFLKKLVVSLLWTKILERPSRQFVGEMVARK